MYSGQITTFQNCVSLPYSGDNFVIFVLFYHVSYVLAYVMADMLKVYSDILFWKIPFYVQYYYYEITQLQLAVRVRC